MDPAVIQHTEKMKPFGVLHRFCWCLLNMTSDSHLSIGAENKVTLRPWALLPTARVCHAQPLERDGGVSELNGFISDTYYSFYLTFNDQLVSQSKINSRCRNIIHKGLCQLRASPCDHVSLIALQRWKSIWLILMPTKTNTDSTNRTESDSLQSVAAQPEDSQNILLDVAQNHTLRVSSRILQFT